MANLEQNRKLMMRQIASFRTTTQSAQSAGGIKKLETVPTATPKTADASTKTDPTK